MKDRRTREEAIAQRDALVVPSEEFPNPKHPRYESILENKSDEFEWISMLACGKYVVVLCPSEKRYELYKITPKFTFCHRLSIPGHIDAMAAIRRDMFVVIDDEGVMSTWHARTDEMLDSLKLEGVCDPIIRVIGEKQLVIADGRGHIRIISHVNGKNLFLLEKFRAHKLGIFLLTGNGSIFITASDDFTVCVWDASRRTRLARIPHPALATASIDEHHLVTYSEGVFRIFHSNNDFKLIRIINSPFTGEAFWKVHFKIISKTLLMVDSDDGCLTFMNLETGIPCTRLRTPWTSIWWFNITSDARLIVSSREQEGAAVLDIRRPVHVREALLSYAERWYEPQMHVLKGITSRRIVPLISAVLLAIRIIVNSKRYHIVGNNT